jgi:VWFA-related protein
MRRAALSVSLAIGLTLQANGQQPPVTTVTTGVVVDVTVVDGKGKPVLDLAPEDFELFEDGARQRIVSATLVQRGVVRPLETSGAAGGQPSQAASTQSTSRASSPEGAITPSLTAILFDRLSPESRALAHRAALAYVATLTPPHDYAGVFLADLSLRTFQPFTNQPEKLARAVDLVSATAPANTSLEAGSARIQGMDPNQGPTAGVESAGGFTDAIDRERRIKQMGLVEAMLARMELRMREGYQQFLAELEGQSALAGLRSVVSSLAALPGRKSILFFAESVPITARLKSKFDALIGEANRANVTVYAVDAAGLRVHSKEAELGRNVSVAGGQGIGDVKREEGAWTKELEKQEQMLNSRPGAVLGRLAKDTGGFLLENTNDLGAGVARMQQERTTYYLLTYQPTNTKLDGQFRKINVKVKRPKMTVRARPGYVAPETISIK